MRAGHSARSGSAIQAAHIDHKAVTHVSLEHPLISLVDLLDRNHLDVRDDVVFGAEVEHFLGFGNAADQRAGQLAALEQQMEYVRGGMRLRRSADQGHGAVTTEQREQGVEVMGSGYGVE